MGKRTWIGSEEFDLGTGNVLVAIHTAAVNSAAAQVRVTRVEIFQNGTTTLEMVRGEFNTRNTSGTLTMAAISPIPKSPIAGPTSGLTGSTAPAGAVGRSGVNSSADSGGSYGSSLHTFNFANLNGYLWKPDPKEELWIPPSTLFVIKLIAAPSSTADWGVSVELDED